MEMMLDPTHMYATVICRWVMMRARAPRGRPDHRQSRARAKRQNPVTVDSNLSNCTTAAQLLHNCCTHHRWAVRSPVFILEQHCRSRRNALRERRMRHRGRVCRCGVPGRVVFCEAKNAEQCWRHNA